MVLVITQETSNTPDVALAELPPIRLAFSIRTTGAPALDASMEAESPAKPPPTTTTGSCGSKTDRERTARAGRGSNRQTDRLDRSRDVSSQETTFHL